MNYVYFEKRFSSLTEEFQKSNRSLPFLFQSSKIVYRSHFSYVHIRSFRALSGKTALSDNAAATHGARKIRALRHCPPPRCAAWHRAPRWGAGVTRRRALRGYRGRPETPPAKLSACATCHIRTRNSHAHCPWRLATAVRGMASCAPLVPRGAVPLR